MAEIPARLDDLIAYVRSRHPDGGPLDHLSDAVLAADRLGEVADHLIGHFVDQARRAGASWTEIGQSMGVTKQAAQKRFVPRGPDELPASVLGRFTKRARHVLERTEEIARGAGSPEVGTEHLLLGMLSEPVSLAIKALEAQGVTQDAVRVAAVAAMGPSGDVVPEHIPFSVEAKKVRDLVVREALRLGHNYVGTEHMLLGLLESEESTGGQILTGLGVTKQASEDWIVGQLRKR
ncbi:ATP-dependent Clp protease ATP-binding subunit [Streptosporangiaceae bacterium NEAU-GS5]|nr:ATP-dependent Clp protease ATP-binding subunit [Streptosporangiaceae bacterium NEAU-GS5]